MNAFNNREVGGAGGGSVTEIYRELESYPVNLGEKTVHAKRMPGFFRSLKTWTQFGLWLPFFLLPYLRWNGKQAVLFDIDHSQIHFFALTVLPEDIWVLSLVLLVAAITMFAVNAVASRIWCGYFCFQTTWTDWFTRIEEKIEGSPAARRKLDDAAWSFDKLKKKTTKHAIWIALALLTGISYSIWFVDAFEYWNKLIRFQLPLVGWVVLAMFLPGTYFLAGWMREQTCFWMCPYARIQSVMTDSQTIMPTYDFRRGEPRGKLRRGGETAAPQGDCIDCFQCAQVCPTGVDIRQGQLQLGCITCGMCVDACDSVMDKIGKPRGLIRYASLDEMQGKPVKKLHQNPRVWIYATIIVGSLMGIVYGLTHMTPLSVSVIPERQPLFVRMSDGSIQNRYEFKVMNKTAQDMHIVVTAAGGIEDQVVIGSEKPILIPHERGTFFTLFVRAPGGNIAKEVTPLKFKVKSVEQPGVTAEYRSNFNGPR